MSLVELAGVPVVAGTITLPRFGRWVADLELASAPPAPGSLVTLSAPGLALTGHVARVGAFTGTSRVRAVAGAGGLPRPLRAAAFRSMPVSLLLADVLDQVGERASSTIAEDVAGRTLLAWVRPAMSAGAALSTLAEILGVLWRILADGTVWLGEDKWLASPAAGVLLDADPLGRAIHVGFETMGLLPGTTWNGARVDVVTHDISDTGFRTQIATP